MGVSRADARGDEPGQWMLVRDFMPIYMDAWEEHEKNPWNYYKFDEDPSIFQVSLPFCYAPTIRRSEFFEELLTVNLNLQYGKYCYNGKDNVVALVFRKPGSSLQPAEVKDTIDALCYYCEMTYHVLKDEFKLKRVSIAEE